MFTFGVFSQELNKIIAKVNNDVITLGDLNDHFKMFSIQERTPDVKDKILENIIQKKLIIQVAKKDNLEVPDDWVETKMDQLISAYPSYEKFEESLVEEALTVTILKERIREDFLIRQTIEKYVSSQITVSPKEITDYYSSNVDEFSVPTNYICWIAKSNKKSFLEELAQKIREIGFDKIVEEKRDLFFKIESDKEGLKEEVREAIKGIKEDEFKIEEIDEAYYLIYLKKIIPPYKKFLEEVKDEIHSLLWKDKFEKRFEEWIDELKSKAVIKIYE